LDFSVSLYHRVGLDDRLFFALSEIIVSKMEQIAQRDCLRINRSDVNEFCRFATVPNSALLFLVPLIGVSFLKNAVILIFSTGLPIALRAERFYGKSE
jgi:hypothetical protein